MDVLFPYCTEDERTEHFLSVQRQAEHPPAHKSAVSTSFVSSSDEPRGPWHGNRRFLVGINYGQEDGGKAGVDKCVKPRLVGTSDQRERLIGM